MKKEDETLNQKLILVFANGTVPGRKFLKSYLELAEMIVCADGGANKIVDLDIKPDIIVGDLDSVTKSTLNTFDDVTLVRRPEQNATDLQKTLEYIESRGNTDYKIHIFGATGDRIDHFLGNLSMLKKFHGRLSLDLIDEQCSIRYIDSICTVHGVLGQSLSLFPLSGTVFGLTTTGLKYNLTDEELEQNTHGISNEFSESDAAISIKDGGLIIIQHHQPLK